MSFAFIAAGAETTGFDVALTPAMPAGFSAGNILLLHTGSYQGSQTLTPPAGWLPLSPFNNAQQTGLYGKIAVGGDSSPSMHWPGQFAYASVLAYSGNQASLTGIVHASLDTTGLSTLDIVYNALTITAAGCLVIAAGQKNKTSTSNGATFNSITGFTQRQSSIINGATPAGVFNDQIQTTATNIASLVQAFSIADPTSQDYESFIVALLPASSPPATTHKLTYMGVG